jgi:bacillolysin
VSKRQGKRGIFQLTALLVGLTVILAGQLPALGSQGPDDDRSQLVNQLREAGVKIGLKRNSDRVNLLGAHPQAPLMVPGLTPGASPAVNAKVLIEKYGGLFGLNQAGNELALGREGRNGIGGGMVRYQQHYRGVPVMGGELVVNMDRGGSLLSMDGEIGTVPKNFALVPQVDRSRAVDTALAAVAKWYRLAPVDLTASTPELTIYDAALLGPGSAEPVRLVWRLEVTPRQLQPIRELILIDATSGNIALHFNQVDNAKERITYTANHTSSLPGTEVCNETSGDTCTNGVDPEADDVQLYTGATYDFFLNYHNRDSFDDAGGAIISTVHYNDGYVCPNAYWNGVQMVYCDGIPEADDVVAHELNHAVTQYSSNLFYYYQSGAIDESLSDVWGEFVDQTDGYGDDSQAVKWKIGEDLVAPGLTGAIRDMKNPPAFHQPDKMTSSYYYTGTDDYGGVHTNSGINNKAAYLLTDGDNFNGQTVTGLGITKAAKIYYEAQTNLLTSGSDYQDLANDLNQSCVNLLGTSGITDTDCAQVQAATAAVEMDRQPVTAFNPEAQVCPDGMTNHDTFFDDFENGLGKWTLTLGTGNLTWLSFRNATGYPFATSGLESLFGYDVEEISDQRATITVAVPAGQPYLHFRHAFDFEYNQSGSAYYDGGVLEYSTDNGSTWTDAADLIDSGMDYNGTIYSGPYGDNPLKGKEAFAGISHGYVSTRLNLAALAGRTVKFRWRVGTDTGLGNLGWLLDDVRIYTCANIANIPPVAVAGPPQTVNTGATVTLVGGGSSDQDGSIASYSWTQIGGLTVTLNGSHTSTPSFKAPTSATALTFRLTVTDNDGASANDTITVTVIRTNTAPFAEAGLPQTVNPGATVTLDGRGSSDQDGSIASYAWTQTGGLTVTLSGANTATPSFSAPASATVLNFRLTVTDNDGASASDITMVQVNTPITGITAAGGGGGGGGCSISRDGSFEPLLLLAFLASLVMIGRSRGRE